MFRAISNLRFNKYVRQISFNSRTSDIISDKNFNFKTFGVGGLNKQFCESFQKSFITRCYPRAFKKMFEVKHTKGLILQGPSGVGKSLTARKISEILSNDNDDVKSETISGLTLCYLFTRNDGEQKIQDLFTEFIPKSCIQSRIIIINQFDHCFKNNALSNLLLCIIDNMCKMDNILFIAIVNQKDTINREFLKSGRFDVILNIDLPDYEGRKEIFEIQTQKLKNIYFLGEDFDLSQLSTLTDNFTGLQIETVVKNATSAAVQENWNDIMVKMNHFIQAIAEYRRKEQIPETQKIPEIIYYSDGLILLYNCINNHIKQFISSTESIRRSILLCGSEGSGKMTLFQKLVRVNEFKNVHTLSLSFGNNLWSMVGNILQMTDTELLTVVIIQEIDSFLFDSDRLNALKLLLSSVTKNKLLILITSNDSEIIEYIKFNVIFDYILNMQLISDGLMLRIVSEKISNFNIDELNKIESLEIKQKITYHQIRCLYEIANQDAETKFDVFCSMIQRI